MTKQENIDDPNSCWNKARSDEQVFIFLERDEDTADTIRYWVSNRVARGKNKITDQKMISALQCADRIDTIHGKANNKS